MKSRKITQVVGGGNEFGIGQETFIGKENLAVNLVKIAVITFAMLCPDIFHQNMLHIILVGRFGC